MKEQNHRTDDSGQRLEEIVALTESAAGTIELLRREVHLREQRIKELEESEAMLKEAAARYGRMKAKLESLPEAQKGFIAYGVTYKTFDEAFDAAYADA